LFGKESSGKKLKDLYFSFSLAVFTDLLSRIIRVGFNTKFDIPEWRKNFSGGRSQSSAGGGARDKTLLAIYNLLFFNSVPLSIMIILADRNVQQTLGRVH
jgi:hypothetical protein